MMKKNESIQVLRAIAALLVVHIHCIFIIDAISGAKSTHLFHIATFGACGVDIFFAISGFILSTVAMNIKPAQHHIRYPAWDFLIRRFIRIFPIYWVLSFFFVLVGAKQHYLTLPRFLNSYLLLPSLHASIAVPLIFAGWTLIFEMFFYYLITLNLFFGTRRVVERTIATILILLAAGSILDFHRPILILIANPMNLEFVFGCAIGLAYARYGKRQQLGTALLFAGAVLLLITLFTGNPEVGNADNILNGALSWYRVMSWGIPAALITSGLAFRATPIRSVIGRLGVELGNASYSIYLISLIVLYLYSRVYPLLARLGASANIAISFVAVIVAGELCYLAIERPLTRWLTAKYHHPAIQSPP
jgi:exopolysaccharide production protein ExoZ